MAARNWRTIDIDALDPEGQLMEDELVDPDPRSPSDALNQARTKNQDVRSALQRSDAAGALATALSDPPYGAVNAEASTITLQTVLSVLNTVRATDIAKVVASLDAVTQDNLMKYIYKGMASVEEGGNCAVLLNWHEKVNGLR